MEVKVQVVNVIWSCDVTFTSWLMNSISFLLCRYCTPPPTPPPNLMFNYFLQPHPDWQSDQFTVGKQPTFLCIPSKPCLSDGVFLVHYNHGRDSLCSASNSECSLVRCSSLKSKISFHFMNWEMSLRTYKSWVNVEHVFRVVNSWGMPTLTQ